MKKYNESHSEVIAGLLAIIISLFLIIIFNTHRAFYFFIILLIVYAYLKLQFDLYEIMNKLDKRRKRK